MNKYRNIKTVVDGITFASKAEARRYGQLKLLERAGHITGLQLQVPFRLYAGIKYIADFVYCDCATERMTAEDVKGFETKEFKLKKRLFEAYYPDYELRVVKAGEA